MIKYFLPTPLKVLFPFSGGWCSSNVIVEKNEHFYCISSYHSLLKAGLPLKYDRSNKSIIVSKIDGKKEGELKYGRLGCQMDFSLVQLNSATEPLNKVAPFPIEKSNQDLQATIGSKLVFSNSTEILLPNAQFYTYKNILTFKNKFLKPGDSGMLVTYKTDFSHIILGWAIGNSALGSHLLPYHYIKDFISKAFF